MQLGALSILGVLVALSRSVDAGGSRRNRTSSGQKSRGRKSKAVKELPVAQSSRRGPNLPTRNEVVLEPVTLNLEDHENSERLTPETVQFENDAWKISPPPKKPEKATVAARKGGHLAASFGKVLGWSKIQRTLKINNPLFQYTADRLLSKLEMFPTKFGVVVGHSGMTFEDIASEIARTFGKEPDKQPSPLESDFHVARDYEFAYAVGQLLSYHQAEYEFWRHPIYDSYQDSGRYRVDVLEQEFLETSFGAIRMPKHILFADVKRNLINVSQSETSPMALKEMPSFDNCFVDEVFWFYVYLPKI